jgi:hypothetical protein
MSTELSPADYEVLNELKRTWRSETEAAISPLRKQVQALMERSSRLPGTNVLEHAALNAVPSLSSQLLGDAAFQAFAKGVLTRTASYATELRLPTGRKAGTPVSGISPTEYLPQKIWGPAQFPLRLREIMPVLPVGSGTIEYTQETSFTPSAAIAPETTVKPTMGISFTEATARC